MKVIKINVMKSATNKVNCCQLKRGGGRGIYMFICFGYLTNFQQLKYNTLLKTNLIFHLLLIIFYFIWIILS